MDCDFVEWVENCVTSFMDDPLSINLTCFSINGRTHIVGFSLGAHVAGFAGHQLKNLSRISGEKESSVYNFFYTF